MLTLNLPSIIQSIRAIGPALSGLPGWQRMSAEKQHDVILATTELVANAIVHGNRAAADATVMVSAEIKSTEIVIVVTDGGTGFDLSSVADPTREAHREMLGGRGLAIVRHLADTLTVDSSAKSCRVTITLRYP